MEILTELLLWHDAAPRSGAMNMAVDQLLLETISELPVLRFYSWDRPSISFGYFDSLTNARALFHDDNLDFIRTSDGSVGVPPASATEHLVRNNLDFIRRWTGGGIVDHRIDLTYTLAIPRNHPWAKSRGAESYRIIHQAVAKALIQTGTNCKLITENQGDGSAACFTNPVTHDIITPDGKKLAGAGQKRTRHGLLHQGSVIGITVISEWQKSFTKSITESAIPWTPEVSFLNAVSQLVNSRYGTQAWLEKQ